MPLEVATIFPTAFLQIDISWFWQWSFEDLTHYMSVSSLSFLLRINAILFAPKSFHLIAMKEVCVWGRESGSGEQ